MGPGERRSCTAMGPSWQAKAETAPILSLRAYFAILTQAHQNPAGLFWVIFPQRPILACERREKRLQEGYATGGDTGGFDTRQDR